MHPEPRLFWCCFLVLVRVHRCCRHGFRTHKKLLVEQRKKIEKKPGVELVHPDGLVLVSVRRRLVVVSVNVV
jgi:hypothetical protein